MSLSGVQFHQNFSTMHWHCLFTQSAILQCSGIPTNGLEPCFPSNCSSMELSASSCMLASLFFTRYLFTKYTIQLLLLKNHKLAYIQQMISLACLTRCYKLLKVIFLDNLTFQKIFLDGHILELLFQKRCLPYIVSNQ